MKIKHQICSHIFNSEGSCFKCMFQKSENTNINKTLDIDYISDIHADFWITELNPQHKKFKKQLNHFIQNILIPKTSNVLVLAGDQGHHISQDYVVLKELKNYYKHIIIVPGNHDYYLIGRNKSKFKYQSEDRLEHTIKTCTELDNVHYLIGQVIEIQGFKIGGLGMWHDESYALNYPEKNVYDEWCNTMNDSKLILNGRLFDYGYGATHSTFDYRKKFKSEKQKLQKIKNVDLMITHYGPRIPNLPEKYKNFLTTFYYFDGIKDIERINPQFWIHGHTHGSYSEIYNETEIICNALGYPDELSYNEIKTITLEKK